VALVAVLGAVAAARTANADIDKSTVDAGRVLIKGKIDTSQDVVVRMVDRGDKPTEWRTGGRGSAFEVVIEASDKVPLEGGKTGHGFVVTTTQGTSKDVSNIHLTEENGTFAIRREADFITKSGVLTFADVTLKDGKKLPVSLRLEQRKKK
jgi:hypothetical protein